MLRIIGVERTQAIQYFGSTFPICANGQPCPDNSIPLVAGKPTVVRVYFEGAALNVAVTGFGVKLLPDETPSSVTFPGKADLVNVPSPPLRENESHMGQATVRVSGVLIAMAISGQADTRSFGSRPAHIS